MRRTIAAILSVYRRAPFLEIQRATFQLTLYGLSFLAGLVLVYRHAFYGGAERDVSFVALLLVAVLLLVLLVEILRRGYADLAAHIYLILFLGVAGYDIYFRESAEIHERMDNVVLFITLLACASMMIGARGTAFYVMTVLTMFLVFVTTSPHLAVLSEAVVSAYVGDALIALCGTAAAVIVFLDMTGRARETAEELNRLLVKEVKLRKAELGAAMREVEAANQDLLAANAELGMKRETMMQEMRLAAGLQRSAQPPEPPALAGWELAFLFEPLMEISGDFYDVYANEDALEGLCIFDVSGHGVSSGLVTMLARSAASHHFHRGRKANLNLVLQALNAELIRGVDRTNYYMTGLLLRVDGDTVEIANAAHPDPLIRRASGEIEELHIVDDERGFMLGMSHLRSSYPVRRVVMHPGDALLMFTDALTEAATAQARLAGAGRDEYEHEIDEDSYEVYEAHEAYGRLRLKRSLAAAQGDATRRLNIIYADLLEFTAGRKLQDDLTAVLLQKL